jgi:hypothetical protein
MSDELISKGFSDECGCPEEMWNISGVDALIHLEPDGTGEIFLDTGGWQDERKVDCNGMCDLRQKAAAWVRSLPHEDDCIPPTEEPQT